MAAKYVERRKLVSRLLKERPVCEAHLPQICTTKPEHIHEIKTRGRGGNILPGHGPNPDANFKAVCPPCHQYITEHPKEAHALGLVVHAWEDLHELS